MAVKEVDRAPRYCSKCRKTMAGTNFYTFRDGTKCELCKHCLTMHVNNFEPDTFLWILEKFDVPWIPQEQNIVRNKEYAKDPHKVTGMTVLGRYFSKMKLSQQNKYRQADSAMLQAKSEEEAKLYGQPQEQAEAQLEEMKKAYENGEISEAQYQTYVEINTPAPEATNPDDAAVQVTAPPPPGPDPYTVPVNSPFEQVELVDVGAELTEEDKLYLATKQGILYRASDQVSLEQLYNEFMESFDIQGAARLDTLKLICKTSLKLNQAIDCGDIDTYQKLSRVYDAMMKAAKFTEAQRKEEQSGEFDSVGQIVYFAEKMGGKIPRHQIDTPIDIVDKAIDNLKRYNHDLIVNDPTLSQMLENLVKRHENVKSEKENLAKAQEKGYDHIIVEDSDYEEFNDLVEKGMAEEEES